MTIVADHYQHVIGVDTHAATHTVSVVTAATGAPGAQATFPASAAGLDRARDWIARYVEQGPTLVVVEGIGSYGSLLSERLLAAEIPVVEPAVMGAAERRGVGKSDSLDAVRIALSVLSIDLARLRTPRTDGPRVAMRVLVVAREQMTCERTRAINALTALVRTVDLGVDARKPLVHSQITKICAWRRRDEDTVLHTCRDEAVRLARRIRELESELVDNRKKLDAVVKACAPKLVDLPGVGAVVAASILIAWSHPGRVRSEAAFASLAGTCPIPASSGNTMRHRLNRGGDRRLNRALTTIVVVRMRTDPDTRTYVARRRAEGRTTKEIMRCLKRYVTRQVFRTLATTVSIPRDA
ncbi:IS110 family transposase [Rhodococcus pyridinivorans]|uniref:IS110 family transposase n=1 Tax=Rhodococcus pyridinivorans TaxID=103816 RepID=UPI001E3146C9|nr:IS110 family transposase [Rhodococcus pyridinivorans]MCD5422693.1 IS110 family transposase [Rhodococcus pyridinivorans]